MSLINIGLMLLEDSDQMGSLVSRLLSEAELDYCRTEAVPVANFIRRKLRLA